MSDTNKVLDHNLISKYYHLPRLHTSTAICAIKQDVPVLPQPALSKTSAKTVWAEFFGQSTSKGIKVMTKPPR